MKGLFTETGEKSGHITEVLRKLCEDLIKSYQPETFPAHLREFNS